MIEGFEFFKGFLDPKAQRDLVKALRGIIDAAPLYTPLMPRSGRPFSVRMTNAGPLGWVSDKTGGYRYQPQHPVSGLPWPAFPPSLLGIWREVSNWDQEPEACLVNYYGPGAKLGAHVDQDEAAEEAPVVSVSLGDEAVFFVGGLKRADKKTRFHLKSGDVVVLGGAARRAYHGIDRVMAGSSDLLDEGGRFNLTLRRVTL